MRDATLCCIVKNGKILLMLKKKGIGKGKITAPGGKIEEGETLLECAIREVKEEVGLVVSGAKKTGEIAFSNGKDGMVVHIFIAHDFEGDLTETDEASPFWADVSRLPWDKMWADYSIWMPLMFSGKNFGGICTYTEDWENITREDIGERLSV